MALTTSLETMLIILLLVAVISDLSEHRIPNMITLFGALIGIGGHLYLGGLQGAAFALGGFALGMACLLPFYVLGGMGAGDVKMMGAIGAFVGPQAALLAVGVALVCGALGALVLLLFAAFSAQHGAHDGTAGKRNNATVTTAGGAFSGAAARRTLKTRFPYALALAAGAIASLVYLRF
jgi:prepilin peptidase CpaA